MKMRYFMAGAIMSTAIESLHKDLLGMDRYVAAVQAEWLNPRITVPLALLGVAISILMFHSKGEPK